MKLIQVSDLHLTVGGERVDGRDPGACLARVIADINAHHADADLVVITGDLAHQGAVEAYRQLAEALTGLMPPWRLTLGNHDLRAPFATVFPTCVAAQGHVQSLTPVGDARVILADSLSEGEVGGRFDAARLGWLSDAFQRARGHDLWVFVHHPPMALGLPAPDSCRLEAASAAALAALCQDHGRVRLIGAGHVHRPCSGLWRGLPFVTVRGGCHQTELRFDAVFAASDEPFGYAIHLSDGADQVTHMRDLV